MSNGKKGAFPIVVSNDSNDWELGLSKRELFAGLAMMGLCADTNVMPISEVALWAVQQADALLAELAKERST
jgi:hypothetical protein